VWYLLAIISPFPLMHVVCIATDSSHTYFGRCGEDSPLVSIPTSLDPLPPLDAGAVKDWETLFSTWWRGLEHLDVSLLVR
jgi:hypothetical protein